MAVRFDGDKNVLAVAVRDLAEAAAPVRTGGGLIGPRRREMGRRAHADYRRGSRAGRREYRSEKPVRLELALDGCEVVIAGRLDAVYEEEGVVVVEEVKSVASSRAAVEKMTHEELAGAAMQLAIYRYLLEETLGREVRGALVLVSVLEGSVRRIEPLYDREATRGWILARLKEFLADARAKHAHMLVRRGEGTKVPFPFERMSAQQEELAAQMDRSLGEERELLVCAPTGSGKTAAALHSALRYAFARDLGVFYVTSKNTQQAIVIETVRRMREKGSCVTAVQLRSRESMCLDGTVSCDPEGCPYLAGFREKIVEGDLLWKLIRERGVIDFETAVAEGRRAAVCPYELALALSERVDVVTGDYNYVFDPHACIRRHFAEEKRYPFVLIIDEAHNLYWRAMEYYSPELAREELRALRAICRGRKSALGAAIGKWITSMGAHLSKLAREAAEERPFDETSVIEFDPGPFAKRLAKLEALVLAHMAESEGEGRTLREDPLLAFYHEFGYFVFVAEMEGEEFAHVLYRAKGKERIRILCLDPSRTLAEKLGDFAGVIAMSATLVPGFFFRRVLGFREDARLVSWPSAFSPGNRRLLVVPTVSTRYRDRARTAGKVARVIETVVGARAGNYVVFFPSFAYMAMVRDLVRGPFEFLVQRESMGPDERDAVLARLRGAAGGPAGRTCVLLAVQGGIFAEGVDYPGEMLCGAVVVGPGLPKVCFEQELLKEYYEGKYGEGFRYAYLYPGMNRVVQSAGRVIRSESDRGVIVLVDDRFTHERYRSLFPEDWRRGSGRAVVTTDPERELLAFWRGSGE
ncbi:MAG: ATP-dependent DNA helicase [Planctomycetota bacterium]